MTRFTTRTTAILICVLAFVVYAHAHPDGPDSFDDMEFTWISSMGSQFGDMIANEPFAHIASLDDRARPYFRSGLTDAHRKAMTPVNGIHRTPPRSVPQSQFPAPSTPPQFVYSDDDQSSNADWSGEFGGASNAQYNTTHNDLASQYPAFSHSQQHLFVPVHDQPLLVEDKTPAFGLIHRHTQPISIPSSQSGDVDFPPHSYGQSIPMSAPAEFDNPFHHGQPEVPMEWPMNPQQLDVPGSSTNQLNFHNYSVAPLQAPQPLPATFPMPNNQFELPTSSPAPMVPEILSSDVTTNYNYQAGLRHSSVGNMRGWIGRAPTTGDRAVPRLDTHYLAPPAPRSANHTPSSASTTPSSARLGGPRRKPWQMSAGDFVCGYCKAAFPTQGDLTHHLRSHTPYMSRQHVCQTCEKRFQYRKDLLRHLPKHDPHRRKFYCPYPGCKYHAKGFGRQDHLDRHLGSQHAVRRVDTPLQGVGI